MYSQNTSNPISDNNEKKDRKTATSNADNISKNDTQLLKIVDNIVNTLESVSATDWEHYLKEGIKNDMRFGNGFTNHQYNGINKFICFIDALVNRRFCSKYATFNNIKKAGGQVKKGSESLPIYYINKLYFDADGNKIDYSTYKELEEANKDVKFRGYTKVFRVFNLEDTTGLDLDNLPNIEDLEDIKSDEDIDNHISLLMLKKGLKINHDVIAVASYHLGNDEVNLPLKKMFKDDEAYYSTLFHELIHWTGHESRLNRDLKGHDDKESYSQEELIAELGAMLFGEIYNKVNFINSVRYLKAWLKHTADKNNALLLAIKDANKAVHFLKNA